jgi:hypothetical protein
MNLIISLKMASLKDEINGSPGLRRLWARSGWRKRPSPPPKGPRFFFPLFVVIPVNAKK